MNKGNKNCKICQGSGVMSVDNGRGLVDHEECFCTIAYKHDEKLQEIALDSVK